MIPSALGKLIPAVLALCWSPVPAGAVISDPVSFASTSFDYIIVGGGTTGLSIAARLSEKPDVLVGVIEAGEYREDNNILIPGFAGSTLGNPEYDWLLSTVPQPQLHNRSVGLGRGKLLGGTSALNFLAYERASSTEYDGWQVLGNDGFTFEEVLPFMQATENWTVPDQFYVDNFLANNDTFNHGSGGPVQTTAYANYSDLEQPFFATMGSLGVQPNIAPSGGDTVGMWSISVGLDPVNKTRSYAANAFYEPNADRHNLVLLTGAQGIRVYFADTKESGDLFHATGVEFVGNDNVTRVASASREIILSAGSLKTPQVLELSGIGNATLLRELGLPPIIDLPGVGENLQDHPGVIAEFQTLSNQTTYDELNDPVIAPQQFAQYIENRTGLYSAFASTCVFLPWSAVLDNDTIQTFKADLDKALASDTRFHHPTFELQRQWLDDDKVPQLEVIFFPQNSNVGVGNGTQGERFYTISTLVQHPWNRGSVHVTSSNGLEAPKIDMAYLESPADIDLRVLVEALRFAHKISQTEPMKSLTPAILAPTLDATDDELISWARNTTSTNFHIVGSTAMLPRESFGVVDNTFKVYGTDNLRIVDAGVYPLQMASHPVATLYGLGERAAHIISSTYV